MSEKFSRIGIVGNHPNPLVRETVYEIARLLLSWGMSIVVERDSADAGDLDCPLIDLSDFANHCDCVVVVGGDGNLLSAARVLSCLEVPLIGVNRGNLGFLTEVMPDQLADQLRPILLGEYIEERRFLLTGRVYRRDDELAMGSALNDIVLFTGQVAKLLEFDIHIDGRFVCSQRADGLIVSTPTGSTAYSLSAGGPIMSPDLAAILLCPLSPHTLTNRPIVVSASSNIMIQVGRECRTEPGVSFDGQMHQALKPGDKIMIQQQPEQLRLLQPRDHDYYHVLRDKLKWNTQLVGKQTR